MDQGRLTYKEISYQKESLRLIPWSDGHRTCPAISLSQVIINLVMHTFEVLRIWDWPRLSYSAKCHLPVWISGRSSPK